MSRHYLIFSTYRKIPNKKANTTALFSINRKHVKELIIYFIPRILLTNF